MELADRYFRDGRMSRNQKIGRLTSSMRSLCLLAAVASFLFLNPRLVTAWLENQFDYEGLPENLTPLNEDAVRLALTHEQGEDNLVQSAILLFTDLMTQTS